MKLYDGSTGKANIGQKKISTGFGCGIIFLVFLLLGIIGAVFGKSNSSKEASERLTQTTTSQSESTQSEEANKDSFSDTGYEEVDYVYLYNNYDSYKDKKVKIKGSISTIDTNIMKTVYITFEDGLGEGITELIYCNLTSSQGENALAVYQVGDYVEICGEVGTKVLGTVNIDDCYIVADGENVKAKIKEEEEEKQKQIELDKEEYKKDCKTFDYIEISRNPNNYKGQKCTFEGKVIQVMESGNNVTLRVDVTKTENEFAEGGYLWDNTIYVEYTRKTENESRILEDDIIYLYGTLNGVTTYTTVLGSDVTIPYMLAEYIDIQGQ